MAEIHDQGRVVEVRDGLIVLRRPASEETYIVRAHDAEPGDYVWIYNDGQVEVKNRPPRLPAGVTERTLPSNLDPDHS